jgi:immune inhibitor A
VLDHPPRSARAALVSLSLLAAGLSLTALTGGAQAAPSSPVAENAAASTADTTRVLVGTVDAPGVHAPGQPFQVTGTIAQSTATLPDATSTTDVPVPADATVRISDATGAVLATEDVTAAPDGTFTTLVPGSATGDVVTDDATHLTGLRVAVVDATYTDPISGTWSGDDVATTAKELATEPTGLVLGNSFVSSVGWVKPGESYPSSITLTNLTGDPVDEVTVSVPFPDGSVVTQATTSTGTAKVVGDEVLWTVPTIAGGTATDPTEASLVLESRADSLVEDAQLVWKDLSSTATLAIDGLDATTATSHGPKVIPPSEVYDTARYGDRPFPIIPVEYRDRAYQATHSGESLEEVINDPAKVGSTFNLYQEMSLGQLFPNGTVPSAGIATSDFTSYDGGFPFTSFDPAAANTCVGLTQTTAGPVTVPAPGTVGGATYTERITAGVYNLPGNTGYYGSDSNGSAILGSLAGVGALQNIDSGCGPTGKLVADAAAIADPEIDYSDYDTDKDGVVDFFMVVFAGCGGNGASQLGAAGCPDHQSDAVPYDNIWPHSSSLEGSYSDPVTGLPGFATDDQLEDLEGRALWWTDTSYSSKTTEDLGPDLKVFVRVGPYNVNPETAIDHASVISHEYGHSLGLPDFYSTGSRETYGDWNLMATDKSQDMDAYGRQELGWVVPEVLTGGTTVASGMTDSKQDTGVIHWQTPDGTPYTLSAGPDTIVHNSQMYVAPLPGRTLLDPAAFDSGDGASKDHLWWSGSGNDYGCAPTGGHNVDLAVPGLKDLPAGTPVTLSFKNRWDIEWDFDYGYVLTTTDGGKNYVSHPSAQGYTTSNADPLAGNPNMAGCQTTYDNGLTGSSGSYTAGTEASDRKLGTSPDPVFLADSYDVSDLAGTDGSIRFSYATDPGLARPGWFVDDVSVTATVDGVEKVLYSTDFETSGGPQDPVVYNGGCAADLTVAGRCTDGWTFLQAGAASVQDHAYYLELRDRSGFDDDGHGEADRGVVGWDAGLYLVYTDEAHGYGNVGTDGVPAQSPLDSTPEPGSDTPDLNDAAFTDLAARSAFTDASASPHVDNYTDPTAASGTWEFAYDCLAFQVDRMTGAEVGPPTSDGDLTGDVTFTVGAGCGTFNYGYAD